MLFAAYHVEVSCCRLFLQPTRIGWKTDHVEVWKLLITSQPTMSRFEPLWLISNIPTYHLRGLGVLDSVLLGSSMGWLVPMNAYFG